MDGFAALEITPSVPVRRPQAESTADFEDFASSRSSVPPAALQTFQLKLSIWFLTMGPVAAAAELLAVTAWLFLVERARKARRM
jgi:hypothetical protein